MHTCTYAFFLNSDSRTKRRCFIFHLNIGAWKSGYVVERHHVAPCCPHVKDCDAPPYGLLWGSLRARRARSDRSELRPSEARLSSNCN